MPALSGGANLQRNLDEIARKLKSGGIVSIGFLEGSTYPDGTSVPMVAVIQEFGAPAVGIPPRPSIRNMIQKYSSGWPATIEGLLQQNDYDVQRTLEQTGAAIAGQLRQSIVDTNAPPLSEVTLLLRKWKAAGRIINRRVVWEAIRAVKSGTRSGLAGTAAKPLIETGHLVASVDYEVTLR